MAIKLRRPKKSIRATGSWDAPPLEKAVDTAKDFSITAFRGVAPFLTPLTGQTKTERQGFEAAQRGIQRPQQTLFEYSLNPMEGLSSAWQESGKTLRDEKQPLTARKDLFKSIGVDLDKDPSLGGEFAAAFFDVLADPLYLIGPAAEGAIKLAGKTQMNKFVKALTTQTFKRHAPNNVLGKGEMYTKEAFKAIQNQWTKTLKSFKLPVKGKSIQLGKFKLPITSAGKEVSLYQVMQQKGGINFIKKLFTAPEFAEGVLGFYSGMPMRIPKNIIDKFKLSPQMVSNIQKGITSDISVKILNEITRHSSDKFVTEVDLPHFANLLGDEPYAGGGDYKDLKDYFAKAKGQEGQIVYMSPDEYLTKIGEGFWNNAKINKGTDKKTVEYFQQGGYKGNTKQEIIDEMMLHRIKQTGLDKIDKYEKIYPGHLEYDKEGWLSQEGHHRALYAKQQGVKEIPVIVAHPTGRPPKGIDFSKTQLVDQPTADKSVVREPKKLKLQRGINKEVGVTPQKDPISTTEQVLLKSRLRNEARGSRVGYQQGSRDAKQAINTALKIKNADVDTIRREIIDYAKQHLDVTQRGKIMTMATQQAKTQKDLAKVMARIDTIEDQGIRRQAISNLKDTIKSINVDELRPEYKADLETLMDIDMAVISDKKLSSLSSRKRFIESVETHNVPQEALDELQRISQKSIKDMTVEDIEATIQAIQMSEHLMNTKNKLIFGRKLQDAKQVVDQSVKNVNKKGVIDKTPDVISTVDQPPTVGNVGKFWGIDSSNPEMIAQELDKEKYGIIKKTFYDDFDRGVDTQLSFVHQNEDFVKEKLLEIFPNGKVPENWSTSFIPTGHMKMLFDKIGIKILGKPDLIRIKLPSSGKTMEMTKGERISFLLHSLNDKNMKHLLEGQTSFANNITKGVQLDSEDVMTIIDSMTEEEQAVAQMMHEWLNGPQRQAINSTSVNLDGVEVANEENYWTIRTNSLDRHRDALKAKGKATYTQRTLEGQGFLKKRTNSSEGMIIQDAFEVFFKSVNDSASYIGLAQPLRNMKMLVNDNAFGKAIIKNYGKHYLDELHAYISDMELMTTDRTSMEKLATGWINRLDIAFLGLNPFVIGLQPLSYLAAFAELNLTPQSCFQFEPASREEMSQCSPQLRDRFKGKVNREAGEIAEMGAVRALFTGKKMWGQKMMQGLARGDYEAIGRIWNAVKVETRKTHPDLAEGSNEFMQQVANRSWEVIRKTQPTFHPKDRGKILRATGVWSKLMTKYTTQLNKYSIMLKRGVEEFITSAKTLKDKGKLVKTLLLLGIILPGGKYLRDEVRDKLLGKDPKEAPLRGAVLRMIGNNFGMMFGLNRVMPSIISKIEQGTYGGYGADDMITSTLEKGINGLVQAYNAIDQYVSEEEYSQSSKKYDYKKGDLKWKKSAERSINNLMGLLAFEGVPIGTVKSLSKLGIHQYNNIKGLLFADRKKIKLKDRKNKKIKTRSKIKLKGSRRKKIKL